MLVKLEIIQVLSTDLRGLEKLQDDISKLEKLDNLEKSKLADNLDKLSDELFED